LKDENQGRSREKNPVRHRARRRIDSSRAFKEKPEPCGWREKRESVFLSFGVVSAQLQGFQTCAFAKASPKLKNPRSA